MKVRDGCGQNCYDSSGKSYWANGDFTGVSISWRRWYPNVEWVLGHGEQIHPYHTWKKAFFGDRKIRHEDWQVKRFGATCSCWGARAQYRRFAEKSYRRWSNMAVHGSEWEKMGKLKPKKAAYWW